MSVKLLTIDLKGTFSGVTRTVHHFVWIDFNAGEVYGYKLVAEIACAQALSFLTGLHWRSFDTSIPGLPKRLWALKDEGLLQGRLRFGNSGVGMTSERFSLWGLHGALPFLKKGLKKLNLL